MLQEHKAAPLQPLCFGSQQLSGTANPAPGPAPIHHPTSALNILAVINRFEESLSLLTTCFTLDSRHESKQNRSTPA